MDYYNALRKLNYEILTMRGDGKTTRLYLTLKNGDKIPVLGEKVAGKRQKYYFVEVESTEGQLLNVKYCRRSSAAFSALKKLYLGIPELIKRNDDFVKAAMQEMEGLYRPVASVSSESEVRVDAVLTNPDAATRACEVPASSSAV